MGTRTAAGMADAQHLLCILNGVRGVVRHLNGLDWSAASTQWRQVRYAAETCLYPISTVAQLLWLEPYEH